MAGSPQQSQAKPSGVPLDVVCIGTALVDHLAFGEASVLDELGFAKGSMNLVDVATSEAIRARVGEGRQVSGGTTANTAVGVASLGGRSCFLGAVADDADGERYAADLEAAGVEAMLKRLPAGEGDAATGRCIVVVTPDAERTMATALGLGPHLDPNASDAELFSRTRLVYLDGYVLDFPAGEEIVRRVVELAQRTGTSLAFGLGAQLVVERHHALVRELAAGPVDVLLGNEAEMLALSHASDVERAAAALSRDGLVLAATRAADGALVMAEGRRIEVPAETNVTVVDATGAGDMFAAGLCFGLSQGLDVEVAARVGGLAASEAISHLGARPERRLADVVVERGLLLPPARSTP